MVKPIQKENAGHSDIGTTMLYRYAAQTDRHATKRTLSLAIEYLRRFT
jgi:hypothetical protein